MVIRHLVHVKNLQVRPRSTRNNSWLTSQLTGTELSGELLKDEDLDHDCKFLDLFLQHNIDPINVSLLSDSGMMQSVH